MFGKNKFSYLLAVCGIITLVFFLTSDITKAEKEKKFYKFNDKNQLLTPEGYREWIFVGTPVTPNDMNNGKAPFPEFHNVYIDPVSYKHYKKTGKFREGTVIAKELTRVRAPDGASKDGSTTEVSGTGYFMGEYSG